MKIIIIGAVAAGTSAAAKARRNDENAEIKLYEMDTDISYSACGLPYYLGNEVGSREQLVPRNPAFFKSKYNVDVFIGHQVLKIDPGEKTVLIKSLVTGNTFVEPYDKLIIATGARPVLPPIAGIDKRNVFSLRNVKSADSIKEYINQYKPGHALIVGSGFIGLEMAENLKALGMQISIAEMEDHLMKPLDRDVSAYLAEVLEKNGVEFHLNDSVHELHGDEFVEKALLGSGKEIDTGMVIVAAGIRPNTELAAAAGIELGAAGAIKVNSRMETSMKDIYACGDCAEAWSLITGKAIYRPLGSTANKTGRIAGDQVTGGDMEFRGILGTGIFRFFDTTVAQTGLTEKEAREEGFDIAVCHNIKPDKPDYFNGQEMLIKAVADRRDGRLLGVQIVGKAGVDKRIDVFVTAMTFGAKAQDLFHLDLAYAPPFSTTKDPVLYTGMILTNEIERGRRLISAEELERKLEAGEKVNLIDARVPGQYLQDHVPNAINLPQESLRKSLQELDKDVTTVTYCNKGVTGNAAQNILINNGYRQVYNLSGGHKNYSRVIKRKKKEEQSPG